MAMRKAYLHVKVVDANGNERTPGKDDSVDVDGKNLSYDATDGFVHELADGDISLRIRYKGFEELRQSFTAKAPAERPSLDPFWPGAGQGLLLECMHPIIRAAGGHRADRSADAYVIRVMLFPTREYIAVIGTDYYESWDDPAAFALAHQHNLDFDRYARTFADHLFLRGLLNTSSPFTMMKCQEGVVERWMRAVNKGWRRQFVLQPTMMAPTWDTKTNFKKWQEDNKAGLIDTHKFLGAPAVYKHLSAIGTTRPGTVIEVSVFSHAWHGGPILFNTNASAVVVRAGSDLDMRKDQDFEPANASHWPNMPAAFTAGALAHVWGCFDTAEFDAMVRFLDSGSSGRFRKFGHDLDRAGVVADLSRQIDADNYMKRLAAFITRDVFGGIPGFGAENIPYNVLPRGDKGRQRRIGERKIMHVPVINGIRWDRERKETVRGKTFRGLFESAELGSREFNEFGYMKYVP